jgi:hypothetical protein
MAIDFAEGHDARVVASIAGVGFACMAMTANAAIVIDDFTQVDTPSPWSVVQDSVGTTTNSEGIFSSANVVGGIRDSIVTADSLFAIGLDSLAVTIDPVIDGGVLDYASSVGASGLFELQYGAGGNDLNLDLTGEAGLSIAFQLFDFAEGAPLDIITRLYSNNQVIELSTQLLSAGAQNAFIEFTIPEGGLFSASDVDRIDVVFAGSTGADFRITNIMTVVPAPAAWAVLIGVGAMRRRRRG